MRKSLLKTLVATAIVGAVMSVSSVVAMAADTIYSFGSITQPSDLPEVFTPGSSVSVLSGDKVKITTYKYNNTDYSFTNALKLSNTSDDAKKLKLSINGKYNAKFFVGLGSNSESPTFHVGTSEFDVNTGSEGKSANMVECDVQIGEANKNTDVYIWSTTKSTLLYMVALSPVETSQETFGVTVSAKDSITNNPVTGFSVYAADEDGAPTGEAITATNGVYTLQTLTNYVMVKTGYANTTFTVSDTTKEVSLMPENYITNTISNSDLTGTVVGDQIINKFLVCNYTKLGGSSTKYIQVNENSGVIFKISSPAKLTLTDVRAGGSGNRSLVIEKDGTPLALDPDKYTDMSTAVSSDEFTLEAGTYYIKGVRGTDSEKSAINIKSISVLGILDDLSPEVEVIAPTSTKAAIAKVGDKYYAFAVVTTAECDDNSAIKFNDKSVETVYSSSVVTFGNRTTAFDAALLDKTGNITGVELENTNASTTATLTEIQNKVTVELVPLA